MNEIASRFASLTVQQQFTFIQNLHQANGQFNTDVLTKYLDFDVTNTFSEWLTNPEKHQLEISQIASYLSKLTIQQQNSFIQNLHQASGQVNMEVLSKYIDFDTTDAFRDF
ncbi:unnamed protein product [Bursaphelenchus xylophilus]|nr:unnamed protein product [Bursaphelenchus xylophilus]CAG9111990.1 unnamed protein product [Bursaphelenchus xylophilus]